MAKAEAREVVINGTRETLVRVPGRYEHRALQDRTDYRASVDGVEFQNFNLATLKTLIRQHLYRNGYSGKVTFTVELH